MSRSKFPPTVADLLVAVGEAAKDDENRRLERLILSDCFRVASPTECKAMYERTMREVLRIE